METLLKLVLLTRHELLNATLGYSYRDSNLISTFSIINNLWFSKLTLSEYLSIKFMNY